MKKTTLTLFNLTLLTILTFGQSDGELVKKSFDNYKKSILQGQGEEAIKYVNSKTTDYYDKELNLAIYGDSATINDLAIIDKLTVFIARHKIPNHELIKMNGKEFFIYAVNNGMIGKNSVMTTQVGDVTIKDNVAHGQMISNGQKTPLFFEFSKESTEWKVDLTSIFPPTNIALGKMLEQQGLSDNEFIFQTLEALTGRKVTDDIWKPLK